MGRGDLSTVEWERLRPLLPPQTARRGGRWETDGTWARIQQAVQRDADAAGGLDWAVQVDTSVVRAHQHAAGARKGG